MCVLPGLQFLEVLHIYGLSFMYFATILLSDILRNRHRPSGNSRTMIHDAFFYFYFEDVHNDRRVMLVLSLSMSTLQ